MNEDRKSRETTTILTYIVKTTITVLILTDIKYLINIIVNK